MSEKKSVFSRHRHVPSAAEKWGFQTFLRGRPTDWPTQADSQNEIFSFMRRRRTKLVGKQRKRFFVYFSPLFHLFLCTVALKKVGRKREMEKEPVISLLATFGKKEKEMGWDVGKDGVWIPPFYVKGMNASFRLLSISSALRGRRGKYNADRQKTMSADGLESQVTLSFVFPAKAWMNIYLKLLFVCFATVPRTFRARFF